MQSDRGQVTSQGIVEVSVQRKEEAEPKCCYITSLVIIVDMMWIVLGIFVQTPREEP